MKSPRERILEFLRTHPGGYRSAEIAESLGFPIEKLRLELAEMSTLREIRRSNKGLYRLFAA